MNADLASSQAARLPSLTGIRFILALLVLGYHVREHVTGTVSDLMRPVFSGGRIGVDFFFVLSGFVLTWAARPETTTLRFYRHRFARIWPACAASLLVGALIAVATHDSPVGGNLLLDLALLQAWVPDPGTFFSVNGVTWSLSCEAFFYLMFPFLLRALLRLPVARRPQALAASLVSVTVVQGVCAWKAPGHTLGSLENGWVWLSYISPPIRMLDFIVGMTAALALQGGMRVRIAWPVAAGAFVVFLLIDSTDYLRLGWEGVAIYPIVATILAAAVRDGAGRGTFLSGRTAVWLGSISYAVYLTHVLVLRVLDVRGELLATGPAAVMLGLGTLAVTLVVASLLYTYLEHPLERRLREPSRATTRPAPR